ncbi:hypothetical protein BKA64DRAFT_746349 [Cadophora sp. MPI-SDFR-AT-0126]|nr:hypothetical protein BKA64DRAFT_746349 [Leotiomycetes sp. MPI-SDFR-AT-0126]
MADVICSYQCSQKGDYNKDANETIVYIDTICTLGNENVPCTTPTAVKTEVCGFETTLTIIESNKFVCEPRFKRSTCKTGTNEVPFPCLIPAPNPESSTTNDSTGLGSAISSTINSELTASLKTESSKSAPTGSTPTGSTNVTPTSSTSSSSATSSNESLQSEADSTGPPRGLPNGAAVGIGIGCAIAGAAISALIFLFLFTRYKRRHQKQPEYASHLPNYNSDVGRQEKGLLTPHKNGVSVTESYLPQPAEDDAIIGELSRLRDNIKNHVQSFYITGPVAPQSLDRGVLRELGRDTGIQFSKLQDLLVNRTSRNPALRLCIGWIILSRCDGRGPADTSLLPEEAAVVAALISDTDYNDARNGTLASKLKVISGALLQTRSGQPQPLQSAKFEKRIEQAVLAVNGFLTPFIDSTIDATTDKRIRNLESIVRRASQLALLLFSQPSSWALDFGKSGTAQQGTIVVFPGLLETISEDGLVRQPPRQFHQPEVIAAA